MFQRLRNAGLKLKSKKCTFLRKEVLYLGHLVSREGIATDPGKISKVAGWPVPTTVQEVERFLGFDSYYRQFIRDFAEIAKPLYWLTERNFPFKWTTECQQGLLSEVSAYLVAVVLDLALLWWSLG